MFLYKILRKKYCTSLNLALDILFVVVRIRNDSLLINVGLIKVLEFFCGFKKVRAARIIYWVTGQLSRLWNSVQYNTTLVNKFASLNFADRHQRERFFDLFAHINRRLHIFSRRFFNVQACPKTSCEILQSNPHKIKNPKRGIIIRRILYEYCCSDKSSDRCALKNAERMLNSTFQRKWRLAKLNLCVCNSFIYVG